MPKWTYRLTVYNELDRTLELTDYSIAWGSEDTKFEKKIEPGKTATYAVHAPAGTSTGIEFYLNFEDIPKKDQHRYGTIAVNVDIPYWKTKNTSSCKSTGIIAYTGFQQIPDGNHDFATSVTVFKSTGE